MPNPKPQLSNTNRPSPLAARVRAVGNRRGFFAKSSMALAGGAALATEQAINGVGAVANRFHVAGDDTLRIGLIGCGARGRAAACEALKTQDYLQGGNVELVAMADAYPDQLQSAFRSLNGRHRSQVKVGDRRFVGMNGWAELLQCDIDFVILATPPVFRPQHFSAVVDAGKHVMMESFVAVDTTGLERMRSAAKLAADQCLAVGGGLRRRHEIRSQDFVKRLQDGAIGQIESIELQIPTAADSSPTRPPEMSRRDFELRNWRHFAWAGGELGCDGQADLWDLANWIFESPVSSFDSLTSSITDESSRSDESSLSDESSRSDEFGFTFRHGEGRLSLGRIGPRPSRSRSCDLLVHGSEGTFAFQRGQIRDRDSRVRWQSDLKEPAGGGTQTQFNRMIQAIRDGERFDESKWAIDATASGILAQSRTRAERLVD
jgi:predicted dehydrogenase